MSDQCRVWINLARLAERLSAGDSGENSTIDPVQWLKENQFESDGQEWVCEMSELQSLSASEVTHVLLLDGSGEFEGDAIGQIIPDNEPAKPLYPVIGQARKQELMAIPGYESCRVPMFVTGANRAVKNKWKSVCRKASKKLSLDVLDSLEYIHVDDAPGAIICRTYRGGNPAYLSGENVLLGTLWHDFQEIVEFPRGERYYRESRRLVEEGLNHFWLAFDFCLGVHVPTRDNFTTISATEELASDKRMLKKLCRWWPHFLARQDRIFDALGYSYPCYNGRIGYWSSGLVRLLWILSPENWEAIKKMDGFTLGEYAKSLVMDVPDN